MLPATWFSRPGAGVSISRTASPPMLLGRKLLKNEPIQYSRAASTRPMSIWLAASSPRHFSADSRLPATETKNAAATQPRSARRIAASTSRQSIR